MRKRKKKEKAEINFCPQTWTCRKYFYLKIFYNFISDPETPFYIYLKNSIVIILGCLPYFDRFFFQSEGLGGHLLSFCHLFPCLQNYFRSVTSTPGLREGMFSDLPMHFIFLSYLKSCCFPDEVRKQRPSFFPPPQVQGISILKGGLPILYGPSHPYISPKHIVLICRSSFICFKFT